MKRTHVVPSASSRFLDNGHIDVFPGIFLENLEGSRLYASGYGHRKNAIIEDGFSNDGTMPEKEDSVPAISYLFAESSRRSGLNNALFMNRLSCQNLELLISKDNDEHFTATFGADLREYTKQDPLEVDLYGAKKLLPGADLIVSSSLEKSDGCRYHMEVSPHIRYHDMCEAELPEGDMVKGAIDAIYDILRGMDYIKG